jgi:hypothetical protein
MFPAKARKKIQLQDHADAVVSWYQQPCPNDYQQQKIEVLLLHHSTSCMFLGPTNIDARLPVLEHAKLPRYSLSS